MADDLGDQGQRAFAEHPIRHAWVSQLSGRVSLLQQIPAENKLLSLDLAGSDLATGDLEDLVEFDQLRNLEELSLMCNWIDDDGAEFLCQHDFFENLKLLRCGINPMTEKGQEKLKAHFGNRVTVARERRPDHIYWFSLEWKFDVGIGKDFTQLMFDNGQDEISLAIFDHLGNLLETQTRPHKDKETLEDWKDEWDFEEELIMVKRFRFTDGPGILDFNWWAEVFETPDRLEELTNSSLEHMQERMEYWLSQGQFEWSFSGEPGGGGVGN